MANNCRVGILDEADSDTVGESYSKMVKGIVIDEISIQCCGILAVGKIVNAVDNVRGSFYVRVSIGLLHKDVSSNESAVLKEKYRDGKEGQPKMGSLDDLRRTELSVIQIFYFLEFLESRLIIDLSNRQFGNRAVYFISYLIAGFYFYFLESRCSILLFSASSHKYKRVELVV